MIKLKMKIYNMILAEKQEEYQHYRQVVKLKNMNILQVKNFYLPIDIVEQANFTYFPLEKTLEKQIKTIEDAVKRQAKTIEDRAEMQILNTNQTFFRKISYLKKLKMKLTKLKKLLEMT